MADTFLSNNVVYHGTASGVSTIHTGSANVSGMVVDTVGFTGVVWAIQLHSSCASACCTFKVQGAATSASCEAGTTVDLSGTEMVTTAGTGSATLLLLEVHKPLQRFLRLYATRSTSGSTFSAIAILYGPTGSTFRKGAAPFVPTNAGAIGQTSASAGNITYEQHTSPAVGTA